MKIQFDHAAYDSGVTREEAKGFVETSICSVVSGYATISDVVPVYVEDNGVRHHGAIAFYYCGGLLCNVTLMGRATSELLSDFDDAELVDLDAILDYLSTEVLNHRKSIEAIEKRGENNLDL